MVFIDTNMTYSPQFCDLAVGTLLGGAGIFLLIFKLLAYLLCFYLVYRVTQIFITKFNSNKNFNLKKRNK